MTGFPTNYPRNFVVNPSGTNPGELETYMRRGSWFLLGISPLFGMPDLRGGGDDNVVMPGMDGRLPMQEQIDQGVYVMTLRVTGSEDASGNPPAVSPLDTLDANIEYLKANVGRPAATPTRTSKLIRPTITITDAVQTRIRFGDQKGAEITAAFTVTVPGGVYGG